MIIILPLMITLAVEVTIYMLLDYKNLKLFLTATIMNVVLNLAMNFILININDINWYYIVLVIYEILTVIIEVLLIHFICKFPFLRCLIFALIANAASFLVGFLVNTFVKKEIIKTILLIVCIVIYFGGVAFIAYQTAMNYKKD